MNTQGHPSYAAHRNRLKRIRGQVDGIIGMIDDNRYCPDILIQLRAVQKAMQSIEAEILKSHLQCCVYDALKSKNELEAKEKIDEVIKLLKR